MSLALVISRCIKIARQNAILRFVARKIVKIIRSIYSLSQMLLIAKRTNFSIFGIGGAGIHHTGRILLCVGDYRLMKQSEANHICKKMTLLQEKQNVTYTAPEIFGPPPPGWPGPWAAVSTRFPALLLAEWSMALSAGRSDCVYVQGHAIHNDNFNPYTELTYDEVRGFLVRKGNKVFLRCFAGSPSHYIEQAIVIIGGVTPNWAHWTTEYLPKIALADMARL